MNLPDLCVNCSSPLRTFANLQIVRDEKYLAPTWMPEGGCTCLSSRVDTGCPRCFPDSPSGDGGALVGATRAVSGVSERLSAEDKEALHEAAPCYPDTVDGWEWGVLDRAVEHILAAHLADAEARLAKVEALHGELVDRAVELDVEGDFTSEIYAAVANFLGAALRPDPSEARDG